MISIIWTECICGSEDFGMTDDYFRCNSCGITYYKYKDVWFEDDLDKLAESMLKIRDFMGKDKFLEMWRIINNDN
jgi:hypothetical protein